MKLGTLNRKKDIKTKTEQNNYEGIRRPPQVLAKFPSNINFIYLSSFHLSSIV